MVFVTLEDRTGQLELIVFSSALEKIGYLLTPDSVVAVAGTLSLRDGDLPKVIVSDAFPLLINGVYGSERQTVSQTGAGKRNIGGGERPEKIFIRVPSLNDRAAVRAKALIAIFPGAVPVIFFDASTGQYEKERLSCADPTDLVVSELKKMVGEENVVVRRSRADP